MKIRKAIRTDIPGVMELQGNNLLSNVPENERANGFVTTPFTVAQIEECITQEGLFVAEIEKTIIAYAFAASWQYFAQWPIFTYMVSRFESIHFRNEEITTENSFQYGPICIDQNYRGSGLFQKLFELMRTSMSERYPIGVTFINKINTRSFEAHTKKLNLEVIDEFEFNANNFYGLAFYTKV